MKRGVTTSNSKLANKKKTRGKQMNDGESSKTSSTKELGLERKTSNGNKRSLESEDFLGSNTSSMISLASSCKNYLSEDLSNVNTTNTTNNYNSNNSSNGKYKKMKREKKNSKIVADSNSNRKIENYYKKKSENIHNNSEIINCDNFANSNKEIILNLSCNKNMEMNIDSNINDNYLIKL
jgi:hypothetical protein